jgi:hypothetical protein
MIQTTFPLDRVRLIDCEEFNIRNPEYQKRLVARREE